MKVREPIIRAYLGADELLFDNFAGGGGASEAFARAFGRGPHHAINHDPEALAMHAANHPETEHHCGNIWDYKPRELVGDGHVAAAWFSPDCKDHSSAKGGKPVDKKIRALAWTAVRWAKAAPVYGQYPRGLIAKLLPWLRCDRHRILHVCSGSLPRGEGIRVDIRPDAKPDFLADGRKLPFADGEHDAVMLDPPYSEGYAKSLYGVKYPRPSHLLREAARVVRPGGRIAIVHYITPKPVKGTRFVKAFGLSTGFDMPMRAVSIYERDQVELAL